MRKPKKKKPKAPRVFVDDLSPLAQRAVEVCRRVHRSTGWLFSGRMFENEKETEIAENFREVADELVRAGYLEKTVSLRELGSPGEEDKYVDLCDEDIQQAELCLGTRDTFVHPRTGDEILLVPGDLLYCYITTRKMPVRPPPPDERAVALYEVMARCRDACRSDACRAFGLDDAALEAFDAHAARQAAWQEAMDLLAKAYCLPPEITEASRTVPHPPRTAPGGAVPTPGS